MESSCASEELRDRLSLDCSDRFVPELNVVQFLSAKYMRKDEDDLRGLPGSFNDLPITPLMHIGEMADSSAFDQLNKTTANALKGKRMRKMASSQTAKQASRSTARQSTASRQLFRTPAPKASAVKSAHILSSLEKCPEPRKLLVGESAHETMYHTVSD